MTIVNISSVPSSYQLAIPLSLYAQLVADDECAFWGIAAGTQSGVCDTIWTLETRKELANALLEAQGDIENYINYHLMPTWTVAEPHKIHSSHIYNTDWCYLLDFGIRAKDPIQLNYTVIYPIDPADPLVITINPYIYTDINEVKIYFEGTDIDIDPSAVSISGGTLTITIPKCRLVDPIYADNPASGYLFTDNVFATALDIYRVYNNKIHQVDIIGHSGSGPCGPGDCDTTIVSTCAYIHDASIGKIGIDVLNSSFCYSGNARYSDLHLNYLSGLVELPKQAQTAIVRLANSLLPVTPCGCGFAHSSWMRDRNVPVVLTAERLNCPFGLSDGAWFAWKYACSMEMTRLHSLGDPL